MKIESSDFTAKIELLTPRFEGSLLLLLLFLDCGNHSIHQSSISCCCFLSNWRKAVVCYCFLSFFFIFLVVVELVCLQLTK